MQLFEEDTSAINKVLAANRLTTVATEEMHGSITPVAIRLLQHAHHFLRWDNGQLRPPSEVKKLISLYNPRGSREVRNMANVETSEPNDLLMKISDLFNYVVSKVMEEHPIDVLGMGLAIKAIKYILGERTFDNLWDQNGGFNWTVIDTSRPSIALNLGLLYFEGLVYQSTIPLLEGMMAAAVMYPQIRFRAGLEDLALIPKYDSESPFVPVDDKYKMGQYRILVPGHGFTGHYLDDYRRSTWYDLQRSIDRNFLDRVGDEWRAAQLNGEAANIPQEFEQGYLFFELPSFLQGLISMTRTIGVDQPWIRLDFSPSGQNLWTNAVEISQ